MVATSLSYPSSDSYYRVAKGRGLKKASAAELAVISFLSMLYILLKS